MTVQQLIETLQKVKYQVREDNASSRVIVNTNNLQDAALVTVALNEYFTTHNSIQRVVLAVEDQLD